MTVCEFISEPWERLHEFQIEYISAIGKEKKREDKISLYLRADLSLPFFN
jgi:hypothetical protein